MARAPPPPPRVSFSNWLLGGDLVVTPRTRHRVAAPAAKAEEAPPAPPPPPPAAPAPAPTPAPAATDADAAKKDEQAHECRHRHRHRHGSKDVEKKAEESKIEESKTAPKEDPAPWTPAQDETITSMRQRGDSWRMIAQAVGATKRSVVWRWKELCQEAREEGFAGVAEMFDAGSTPHRHRHHHHHHSHSPTPPPEEQKQSQSSETAVEVRVDLAALEDDDKTQKPLRPDAVWTVADLEVLVDLEQQYRRLKWMHVQAGFYNMTGRMVGAEVIRAKFEEG